MFPSRFETGCEPLSQIMDVLEANEVQRPVTIRVNSLKVTRRILAQVTLA